MFRKLFIFMLALYPLFISAQEMPFSLKSRTRFSTSGAIGKVEVDSTSFYRLRFIQEFNYRKFGIGLDLDFLFDEEYHLRKKDWDHIGNILDKIYYFRYAEMNEPFHFHFGGFPELTLGNGLVMNRYSNMYYYPEERNLGLLIGGSPKWPLRPSFQAFSSNVAENNILYANARIQPIPDSTFRFIDIFDIGAGIYADTNQKEGLETRTSKQIYQSLDVGKRAPVAVFSVDYRWQFMKSDKATFGTYAEMAHISGAGTGFILPGFYGDFNFLVVNLEYRASSEGFYPGFFDSRYEKERAVADTLADGTPYIITKEQQIESFGATYGFLCKMSGKIGDRVRAGLGWQNLYGEKLERGKSLWFNIGMDTQYKRMESVAYSYSKTNVAELALGKIAVPNAQMSAQVVFSLNDKRKIFIIGQYSEKYKDKQGEIKWWKDTKRSVSVGVKVDF